MIVHGSNCQCPMIPDHIVMLPGGREMVHWVRLCQQDPGFWTPERTKMMRRLLNGEGTADTRQDR